MAEDLRDEPRVAAAPDGESRPAVALSICLRCRDGREDEHDGVRGGARLAGAALRAGGGACGQAVRGVHCLSQCKRPCAIAVSGADRFTYLFGDLDPDADAAAVVARAQRYAESAHGFMARDARPLPMRAGVLGRVPPLGLRGDAVETVEFLSPTASETWP